jgi:hypothetical protein
VIGFAVDRALGAYRRQVSMPIDHRTLSGVD